jgi:hypothetical protein
VPAPVDEPSRAAMEKEADEFAAEFLMPMNAIRDELPETTQLPGARSALVRIVVDFRVTHCPGRQECATPPLHRNARCWADAAKPDAPE